MPIVMVQRLPWVRKRTLLNNVLFWCSMILGLSLVSSNVPLLPFFVLVFVWIWLLLPFFAICFTDFLSSTTDLCALCARIGIYPGFLSCKKGITFAGFAFRRYMPQWRCQPPQCLHLWEKNKLHSPLTHKARPREELSHAAPLVHCVSRSSSQWHL